MAIDHLGLTDSRRATFSGRIPAGFDLGRVTAVNRTNMTVETGRGPTLAEVTGRLRFAAESPLDLPATGDWVVIQVMDQGSFAVVTDVLPRATELKRRVPGSRVDYQMMAANVDVAFIVHPADQPVHVRRLERYLIMARDGGIEPVIVLSKSDTVSQPVLRDALRESGSLAESIPASSVDPDGLDAIRKRLTSGVTHVLLGPSGVGKSTLVNRLIGEDRFATQEVRAADQKGRHTTTRRELIVLGNGAILIDTPGMRELGLTDMQEGVADTFADIVQLTDACRFRDCTHTGEDGCAVREAVASGDLEEGRYESYLRLEREVAHYERSYLEHRRRDKEFGKLCKSVLKSKRDRR